MPIPEFAQPINDCVSLAIYLKKQPWNKEYKPKKKKGRTLMQVFADEAKGKVNDATFKRNEDGNPGKKAKGKKG